MRYEDYKIENLTFMKGTGGWSLAEKKEFLETCPENSGLQKTLEGLKALKKAIEDGVVKTNKYHDLNKASMKAYIAKHDTNILYGRPWRHYFGTDKDFYINVDGSYDVISSAYNVESLLEKYEGDENIEDRFERLAHCYSAKEDKWSKSVEEDRYRTVNADRISANKKLDSVLSALHITIPVGFEDDIWGRTSAKTSTLRMTDYWYNHSNYGEVLINKTPMTEDQANELIGVLMEMSGKIEDIIKEYRPTIDKAMGKKGA